MPHLVLIYAHALAGLLAFGLGLLVIRPLPARRNGLFTAYYVALWSMIGLLIAVVLLDWPALSWVARLTYGGLVLLGLYTGLRGFQASRLRSAQPSGWTLDYVDHVGFTLIALFDGFVIVAALDLHAPGWLVAVVGVLGVLLGRAAIVRVKRRPVTLSGD